MVELQIPQMNSIFHALGDATRRQMLRDLADGERTVSELAQPFAMSLAAARAGRHALGTKPAEILKNAKAYATLGVETLIISANTSDPREARSALEMIAREVSPALAG